MSGIVLRRATENDERSLFEWRNASETRRYAFNPKPIGWEEHVQWFRSSLACPDRHLFIGELEGQPVGVLRYDVTDETGEISIYLVPGCSGRGLGTALLRAGSDWVANNLPQVTKLCAKILPENVASRKAFAKAGYVESSGIFEYHIVSGKSVDETG